MQAWWQFINVSLLQKLEHILQIRKLWLEASKARTFSLEMTILRKSPALIFITCTTLQSLKHWTKRNLGNWDRLISNLVSIRWSSRVYREQHMMKSKFHMKNFRKIFRKAILVLVTMAICITQPTMLHASQWNKEDIDLQVNFPTRVLSALLRSEEVDSLEKLKLN